MADGKRQGGDTRPTPPPPANAGGIGARSAGASKEDRNKHKEETAEHAAEVRAVAGGKDIVENLRKDTERPSAGFEAEKLQVVRSWINRRPLEPTPAAAAMIEYPRMWTSKRGRYCRFRAPGAGMYALLRARPTF